MAKTLISNYPGKCASCGGRFEAGARIVWDGPKQTWHPACAPQSVAEAAPFVGRLPRRTGRTIWTPAPRPGVASPLPPTTGVASPLPPTTVVARPLPVPVPVPVVAAPVPVVLVPPKVAPAPITLGPPVAPFVAIHSAPSDRDMRRGEYMAGDPTKRPLLEID